MGARQNRPLRLASNPRVQMHFTGATLTSDAGLLAFAELDPIDVIPIAKTGDADKAMIVCEGCLEVRSEHAFGAVMGYEHSAR